MTKQQLVWELCAAQTKFIQAMIELGEDKKEIARIVQMKKSTFEMSYHTLNFKPKVTP